MGVKLDEKRGKWRAQVSYVDPTTGKRKYVTRFFPKTKAGEEQAFAVLPDLRSEAKKLGKGRPVSAKSMTVGEYIDLWIRTHEAKGDLHKSTLERYVGLLAHAKDTLGGVRLAEIQPEDVQVAMNELMSEPRNVSAKQAKKVLGKIGQVLRDARRRRLIDTDPTPDVEMPRTTKPARDTFSEAEVKQILDAAEGAGVYAEAIAKTFLWTGVRIGELCALRWGCVDFERNEIRIEANIVELDSGKLEINDGKTASSRRVILADQKLLAVLRRLRASRGAIPTTDAFVLLSPNGLQLRPNNLRRWWRTFLKKRAKVRTLSPHKARHTYASRALAKGFGAPDVAAQIGHADPSTTTSIYGHAREETRRKMAEEMTG